jgi:hypothetical protein
MCCPLRRDFVLLVKPDMLRTFKYFFCQWDRLGFALEGKKCGCGSESATKKSPISVGRLPKKKGDFEKDILQNFLID